MTDRPTSKLQRLQRAANAAALRCGEAQGALSRAEAEYAQAHAAVLAYHAAHGPTATPAAPTLPRPVHTCDEECTLDASKECACGVSHAEQCPECGGRGYHRETCSEVHA